MQSPVFDYEFSTDANGNVTGIDSNSDPSRRYDRLDCLQTVLTADQSPIESWTHDATGNRTSRTAGGAPETYSYVNTPPGPVLPGSPVYGDYSHRLQAVGTSPRTYDAVGNTLTGLPALAAQNAQAEYDARKRLTGLKVGTSSYLARYEYNGRGERVLRHVGGVGHLFVYDESGQLLGRYATDTAPGSNWTLDEEIVWLENTPIASVRIESGQPVVRAILSDHLNSPRALSALHGGSQPAGTLVWKWSLTSRTLAGNNAYGNEAPDEDPDGNGAAMKFDLRFPGQQYEVESGTYYNYFRDYEPGTGRYVESDPIGLLTRQSNIHAMIQHEQNRRTKAFG